FIVFFFFQAEDGIRDKLVTGVQTCALPIYAVGDERHPPQDEGAHEDFAELEVPLHESAQMLAIDDDDRSVAESPAANQGATRGRSEERRVGKECRAGWGA